MVDMDRYMVTPWPSLDPKPLTAVLNIARPRLSFGKRPIGKAPDTAHAAPTAIEKELSFRGLR